MSETVHYTKFGNMFKKTIFPQESPPNSYWRELHNCNEFGHLFVTVLTVDYRRENSLEELINLQFSSTKLQYYCRIIKYVEA